MVSYHIELAQETLNVKFDDIPATGDQIVRDANARLDELIQSGELRGGETLLKINGRLSLLLSYTLIHKVAHLYKAIAISDPRLSAYVVVSSTTPEFPVGCRIDFITGEVTQVKSESSKPGLLINWEGDILKAELNRQVQVDGDQIVRDTQKRLEQLRSTGELTAGKLLKINGRASVLASCIIANQLAHLYGAVAVFDPKIGDKGLDQYVVTISHNEYQVGECLEVKTEVKSSLKIVLCGPPNTGKTVFREGLKTALLQRSEAPHSYVISGCPDGDYSWHSETAQKCPELAKELKAKYKASFTPEFALSKAQAIESIQNSLLVFDVGGKTSPENQIIMSKASHAVILAKTETDVKKWQEFCQKLNLPVIAILYSVLDAEADEIITQYPPLLTGNIHHLKRGEDVSSRPIIQALVDVLIKFNKN